MFYEYFKKMKTVGVVIPIYNVQKYLKECLDSVINQTYKNLQIILVNDGSTDENSLNIAKEYTLKDERITLFDKENGGQSTARNVGIEYFSGEYKLKSITTQIKENSLIEFELDGNNPYNIYKVYKSYKAFNNEQDLTNFTYPIIDYIIFLDSDDYWELNCIEECVPRMDGVEVLWFDHTQIYETHIKRKKTHMEIFNYSKESVISPKEYTNQALEIGSRDIAFVVMGVINFNFLKKIKLKFINKIINEDIHFGMILFANAKSIYILPKKLYLCRLRANSVSNHDKKVTKDNIASYFSDIYGFFNQNPKITKNYLKAASRVVMVLEFIKFFENNHTENIKIMKKVFLPFYAKKALMIEKFKKDPLNLKEKLPIIIPYVETRIPYDIWKFWQKIKNLIFPII